MRIEFMFSGRDLNTVHECHTNTDPDGRITWRCQQCDYTREYDPATDNTALTLGPGADLTAIHTGFSGLEDITENLS